MRSPSAATGHAMRKLLVALAFAVLAVVAGLGWMRPREAAPPAPPPATPTPAPTSTLSAKDRLAAAVAVAFKDGRARTDEGGQRYTFDDDKLVDTPFGPVLISEGSVVDPGHASAGRIDIAYLRPEGDGFTLVRNYPAAAIAGSFGRLSSWQVDDRFADMPTLRTEGGFTGQGITCSAVVLTELRPTGPVEMAQVPIGVDNTGSGLPGADDSVEGSFTDISRNQGFAVRYAGSKAFTDRWERKGDRYVLIGPSQVPEC